MHRQRRGVKMTIKAIDDDGRSGLTGLNEARPMQTYCFIVLQTRLLWPVPTWKPRSWWMHPNLVPGARVRPPTNYWVSYQPTIGYLTNQLLGILPTNYWVSYQPTIGYLTNQLLGILPTNYWVSYQPTYNIPFINFSSPPLATHAFNDSGSSTTFLLSMFPPPLATHV